MRTVNRGVVALRTPARPELTRNSAHAKSRYGAPSLETPESLSASRAPVVQHAYSVAATIAWEIDFFGRLRSLSDAALQQYFASAQARKAVEILLVSQVADQYLSVLAFDELIRVTDLTLQTAQASYELATR